MDSVTILLYYQFGRKIFLYTYRSKQHSLTKYPLKDLIYHEAQRKNLNYKRWIQTAISNNRKAFIILILIKDRFPCFKPPELINALFNKIQRNLTLPM